MRVAVAWSSVEAGPLLAIPPRCLSVAGIVGCLRVIVAPVLSAIPGRASNGLALGFLYRALHPSARASFTDSRLARLAFFWRLSVAPLGLADLGHHLSGSVVPSSRRGCPGVGR